MLTVIGPFWMLQMQLINAGKIWLLLMYFSMFRIIFKNWWKMYICSDFRSNVEILFVCNICQHKRTFTHITSQAHWLPTRRFRAMAIMVLINFSLTIPIIFFTWIVFVMIFNFWFVYKFRCRWYWWSLEGDMLWWSLASFKCCKIPSHWHWRLLVCEWTNLWQVISFEINFYQ